VSFGRGGYNLELYKVPNTTWTETAITFANAPSPEGEPIALAPSVNGESDLNFDITNFYQNESPSGRISFMIDTEPWPNGTDDLASKEHQTLDPPMLIVTLAAGVNTLVLENNEQAIISNGGAVVLDDDILMISGADAVDIIYTVETAPEKGWFIRGADVLGQGGQFTQADLQSLSLLYIHDGESNGDDTIVLSAKDRTGAVLEDIEVKINIQ